MRNQVPVAGDPLRNHRAEQGTKESREDHEKPYENINYALKTMRSLCKSDRSN